MVDKTHPSARTIFVKFAEVPDGVEIVSSSDAGVRRLKQKLFVDYETGCQAVAQRIAKRAHEQALVCDLVH